MQVFFFILNVIFAGFKISIDRKMQKYLGYSGGSIYFLLFIIMHPHYDETQLAWFILVWYSLESFIATEAPKGHMAKRYSLSFLMITWIFFVFLRSQVFCVIIAE